MARQRERPGHRRARSPDRGSDRRDYRGHLDRDLWFGPAPVRGARAVPRRRATSSATSPWASSRRSAPTSTDLKPGDRVVVPFNISCGSLLDVQPGAVRPVRDHPGGGAGQGCGAVRLHRALRRRCPAARPSTSGFRRPTSARSRCPTSSPDERFLFLSDILPTAWQAVRVRRRAAGRYARGPRASDRSASSRPGSRASGRRRVIGVDLVPERLAMAARHGVEVVDLDDVDDVADDPASR